METPELVTDMKDDFYIWYKTADPVFSEINKKSRLPNKWLEYEKIINSKYKNSIIKPINRYVEFLVPQPKLISIENNIVTLRQGNHAEFFLLGNKNTSFFKHIDRPWMRQYYNTNYKENIPSNCFNGIFKFYSPWYIDANIKVEYKNSKVESPFHIYEINYIHNEVDSTIKYLEPDFIPFSFKKEGSHMIDDLYGKIKRQSPMFDIVFECNDIMLKRVKEFYE